MSTPSETMASALRQRRMTIFHLIEMQFSRSLYLTDWSADIRFNDRLYSSRGGLLSVGSITQDRELQVGYVDLVLSGVDQSQIAVALAESTQDRGVIVSRGLMREDLSVVAKALLHGRIDRFSIVEDPTQGTSTVTWSIASHWADFDQVSGRRTNAQDQQRFFPGDKGFDFAGVNVTDMPWGK